MMLGQCLIFNCETMKNLYLILRKGSNKTTFDLLQKSAEERGICVKAIYTEDFDFTKNFLLTEEDGLYNLCDDLHSQVIEKSIINDKVTSLYENYLNCMYKKSDVDDITSYIIHARNNLPTINSILAFTNNKEKLHKYTKHLGGCPIIIKALNGSHGVGVMKIDSLESLYSVVDYITKQNDEFILRQYIDYKEHARLIVLWGKVISSIEYKRVENDFRSNAGNDLNVVHKKFDSHIEDIAVKAVQVLGYEFGGVDILIDQDGNPFIAEVNFPCYFPRAQQHANIDIAWQIIDFLINKSKNKINIM